MRIRESILFFTVVVCAPSMLMAQTSRSNSEISVRVSTPKRTATLGAAIHVELKVANIGEAALLVPNKVSMASGDLAYLEFEVRDAQGRVSPGMKMIADYAPVRESDEDAAAKLL